MVFLSRNTEGSTSSGSGFKLSQKTVPRFKVSSDRLGEAGNQPKTPGFQDTHLFVAFLGINQFRQVGLRYVLVLRREHPKAHRKWFYREAGNRTCAWYTGHRLIPISKTDKIQVKYIQVWKSPQKVFSFLKKKKIFVAFPWVVTSTGRGEFMICVFII